MNERRNDRWIGRLGLLITCNTPRQAVWLRLTAAWSRVSWYSLMSSSRFDSLCSSAFILYSYDFDFRYDSFVSPRLGVCGRMCGCVCVCTRICAEYSRNARRSWKGMTMFFSPFFVLLVLLKTVGLTEQRRASKRTLQIVREPWQQPQISTRYNCRR